MSSTKCLACWEEIDDGQKICHHCGSDQEDVKDFLALAVLKQQKKKITVPKKTPVLDYIFKVDPDTKEEVTISADLSSSPASPTQAAPTSSAYQPARPTWLGTPVAEKPAVPTKVIDSEEDKKDGIKSKTVVCPHCSEEVPFKQFCKFCGKSLQKECTKCNKQIKIAAKFCTHCGQIQEQENES